MALGATSANDCTAADLFQYLETIPPGSNRRSHFKTLKKLWRWAFQRGNIEVDPMARMKPADEWGVNVEHLTPVFYTQILRVIAGKESPAKEQQTANDFLTLLPYFVLARHRNAFMWSISSAVNGRFAGSVSRIYKAKTRRSADQRASGRRFRARSK